MGGILLHEQGGLVAGGVADGPPLCVPTPRERSPMILRTIKGYALEWGYKYSEGVDINKLNAKRQFEFLPGSFNKCLPANPDIILSRDLDGKTVFARTSDGTLRIESDDTGLLVTADLIDNHLNRQLCSLIDRNRVRGWSHRAVPQLFGFKITTTGDVRLTQHHTATLKELTLVVSKHPRARTRQTPIFLQGGPKSKGFAHV